jgi:hypothetical protein
MNRRNLTPIRARFAPRIAGCLLAVSTGFGGDVSWADVVTVATRAELLSALNGAEPGDEVRIAPGTYAGGMSVDRLRGAASAPILLAAADSRNPPVIEGGATGMHLTSPEHVEIRDLVFVGATGNGLNIDDAGNVSTPARQLVLRGVAVRDVGPRGNCDGIKLSGVDDFQLVDCRVERWGDGGSGVDMVGCHRGVIEESRFVGPGGEQANAVQTKGGSSDVVIRRCRIEEPGGRGVNIGGSTGLDFFRPRDAAYEARNITVEDCEIVGGAAAFAFVGVDGAVVQHNTIYRPRRWAVRILQESVAERFVPCRNGKFFANIVAFRAGEMREAVNVGGATEPQSFEFAANHWACLDRPADADRYVRLPVTEENASFGPAPAFADAEQGDLTMDQREPSDPGVRARE